MADYLKIARAALAVHVAPKVAEAIECATSVESPEVETAPDRAELARASAVLNRAGVRIMALEGGATMGVWSDLDGPEVRAALRTFGSDRLPLRYLDGAGVPMRYKVRRVEGEPVPMNVLAEMERDPAEPWMVRDRMLNEIGWCREPEASIRTMRARHGLFSKVRCAVSVMDSSQGRTN
jgi:hypothetical protein